MAGTTKFKYLTPEVMTRGQHMRDLTTDHPEHLWPDDCCDPYNSADAYLPTSSSERAAATRRAVSGGNLSVRKPRRAGGK